MSIVRFRIFLLFFTILAVRFADTQDCRPIAISVTKQLDLDPVGVYNTGDHSFLILWNRLLYPDRFTVDSSVHGRVLASGGTLSNPLNYSFPPNNGRMSDRTISAAYNPKRNEFMVTWFEIPEGGLGHSTGLYRRRLNSRGDPLEPATLESSTYMFQPRVEYNFDRDEYLLAYGNGLDSVAINRMNASGELLSAPVSFGIAANFSNVLEQIISIPGSADTMIFWTTEIYTPQRSNVTLMVQKVTDSGTLNGSFYPALARGAIPFGRPAIVYNTRTGQFLALLKGKARGLLNIEFKAVVLGANGKGIETPHTIGIVDSRWPPSLAYNPVANEFAVFYARDDLLYFRLIGPKGKLRGPEQLMTCTKRSRTLVGLLFDQQLNRYMAYWTHSNPKTGYDVYSRFIP